MTDTAVRPVRIQLRFLGVAFLVASVHLLAGWVLLQNGVILDSRPTSEPVELLSLLSPQSKPIRLQIDLPMKIATRIQASVPTGVSIEEPPQPLDTMAITVPNAVRDRPIRPPAAEVPEITEWDSGQLSQSCARFFPQVARYLVGEGSATLQVLVEQDGRISQTRLVQSSGDESRDATIKACVLLHGEYTPSREAGVAVASWYRVHWNHGRSQDLYGDAWERKSAIQ
jgi:hypothetical protein